jgi:polyvinyl alcohol dehydrogenase (cytochrome)
MILRSVATLLIGAAALAAQAPCTPGKLAGAWNGWGAGNANTRYQAASAITPQNVVKLELAWAFGVPGGRGFTSQPTIVEGRLYVGADTGQVYALDATTGCALWSFKAEAGVRTSISVAGTFAYFGDVRGNVYAVHSRSGEQLWKTKVESHPTVKLTGAPAYFEGRLYVPVASGEEGSGGGATYACCSFRGSVVALDGATGKQVWKTYVIKDEPKQTGTKPNGTATMGPSGAGIWSAPTIDAKRRQLYVGTGDAYSEPADKATDAIVALDLDTGAIKWIAQETEGDVWISACMRPGAPANCGPDHDFGSPPMLLTIAGRDMLVAGQKSGNVWAHDPESGKGLWRVPMVANTTEFGGKIVWGGAADADKAYFGLGPGGIGAINLRTAERGWFTDLPPVEAMKTHPGHEGPLTAIPGVIFSGAWDGVLRALSAADGKVLWDFNTAREFPGVNGTTAKGGSMGAPGPIVVDNMLFVSSGYVGVKQGVGGNALLAFRIP